MVGTVVAPLSHYSFMLASAPPGVPAHDAHGGAGHGHRSADGAELDSPVAPHVTCNYADLFATFSATPQSNGSLQAAHAAVALAPPARIVAPSVELILPFHLRGPPALVA